MREIRPDIAIMLHSDGAIGKLLPDFIEMGIDVVHPLEPVSGMDPAQVKRDYGDQISFLGGVDISHAMPGTLADVRADVDRCLQDLAPGGGYILTSGNSLASYLDPACVMAMSTAVKKYGRYPITI